MCAIRTQGEDYYLHIVWVDIVTIVAGGDVDEGESYNAEDDDWGQNFQC